MVKSKLIDYITIQNSKLGKQLNICPLCGSLNFLVEKTYWRCNRCNKSGDIFDIFSVFEGITPKEASIKILARRYNIKNDQLEVIDGNTLINMDIEPKRHIIDRILPQGTYLFIGAPKIGKSWLVLWLCTKIANSEPVWEFETTKGSILYLSLEDTYARLQDRLSEITDKPCDNIFFALKSEEVSTGLEEQIVNFLTAHPDTAVVFIDTLQKIREKTGDRLGYASDYELITRLKQIADDKNIAIVIVHHTRKMPDNDPFNTISGTTGLLGAADGAFVLEKDNRNANTAKLSITGRDIKDLSLNLEFDEDTHVWHLVSKADDDSSNENPLVDSIVKLMENEDVFEGTATELLQKLTQINSSLSVRPNVLSRKLSDNVKALRTQYNIAFTSSRNTDGRIIKLERLPDHDDIVDNDDIFIDSPI